MSGGGAIPAIPDDGILAYTRIQYEQLVAPILIGVLMSFMLFGASIVQFVDCFNLMKWKPGSDRWTYYYLWVLAAFDLADTIGKGMFIVQYMGMCVFGGIFGSGTLPRVAVMIASLDASIATLNHAVYAYRIVKLTPKRGPIVWSLLIFAGLVSLAQLFGGCYGATWSYIPVIEWVPSLKPWATLWMGGSALADIILCAMFVWCLARHRSEFHQTNMLILKYISLSIETGFIATAVQLAAMILWLTVPSKPYEISLGCFQSKLYINGILMMVRTTLTRRESPNTSNAFTGSIGTFSRSHGPVQSAPGAPGGYGGNSYGVNSYGPGKEGHGINIASVEYSTDMELDSKRHGPYAA